MFSEDLERDTLNHEHDYKVIPPYTSSSLFMDRIFEREFKQVISHIKSLSPSVFGLHHLDLVQSPIASELLTFVKIKGLSSDNLFKELEDCDFVYVSTKKEFSDKGFLAFSKLSLDNIKAPRGYRLVSCASDIKIPNGYVSPDPQIEYVGQDEVLEGFSLQYFWISEDFLYRQETEVVTVSLKRVSDHLGGLSVILTNGVTLYLVVQDRSRMRNTETKNIYYVGTSVDECKQEIIAIYNRLVELDLAFPREDYTIQKETAGIISTVSLVSKDLEPTMDLDLIAFEVSMSEEE